MKSNVYISLHAAIVYHLEQHYIIIIQDLLWKEAKSSRFFAFYTHPKLDFYAIENRLLTQWLQTN